MISGSPLYWTSTLAYSSCTGIWVMAPGYLAMQDFRVLCTGIICVKTPDCFALELG